MSLNQRIESIITKKLEKQRSIDIISESEHCSQKPITKCVDKLFKLFVKLKESKCRAQKEFPVQIRQRIFVGNYVHGGDEGFLMQKNIGMVICCMNIQPLKIVPNIRYEKIALRDQQGENLLIHRQKVLNVIQNYLNQQNERKILIHCFHGKSRSVAVLILYLMGKQRRIFDELYNQIRGKYPVARVNSWFVKQLKEYEKQIGLEGNDQQKQPSTMIMPKSQVNNNNDDLLSDLHNQNTNHDLLGFSNSTQLNPMISFNQSQSSLLNHTQLIPTIDPKQHLLIPQSQKVQSPSKKKQQYHLIEIQQDEDPSTNQNKVQNVQLI